MKEAADGSRVLPAGEVGKDVLWKVKHAVQWRGPCVVTEKLSNSMYRVKVLSSGKVYTRHVSLIFRAATEVAGAVAQVTVPVTQTVTTEELGPVRAKEVVAVVDEPGDNSVWLMKCTAVEDDEVKGHLFAPSCTNVASARFRLVYIAQKTNLSILGSPRAHERADPWLGAVPESSAYVVARHLQFRSGGFLNAASVRKLMGYEASMLK
jgi:hypothetical protein